MDKPSHAPVLLPAVLAALQPIGDGCFVDATFGGGGYSRALLAAGAKLVIGLDRDPQAVARGQRLDAVEPRFVMREGRFGDLVQALDDAVDGIVFDVGVSSYQLDAPERGFSFRFDGPLDMRMGGHGPTAADIVNTLDEPALADLLRRLGEEPQARRVARAIVRRRRATPLRTTLELAELVRATLGQRPGRTIDPATRTFQGLRIAVNDELGELQRGLEGSIRRLRPGGRLVVVSFHSLEDRIVKQFLRQAAGGTASVSRHQPLPETSAPVLVEILTRKAVRPTADELAANPRARSARLRAARRTDVPA